MARGYRFIGGPLHNKVMAIEDGVNYHEVAKFPKLPSLRAAHKPVPITGSAKRLTYTKRQIFGVCFFMLTGMREEDYIKAIFGPEPSPKAEKRRKQKHNREMREKHFLKNNPAYMPRQP